MNASRPRLAVVVVARDEAAMIDGCLARVTFADEVVVVVDDRTADDTAARAARAGVTVLPATFHSFSQLKNAGIDATTSDWILIVDADERVTGPLAAEVRRAVTGTHDAYRIPIENYFFGARIRHGGWREQPIRLFRRGPHYTGDIHETLALATDTSVGILDSGLVHFSHRSIRHNLSKTLEYAELQAREMHAAGHPRVTRRTLARIVGRELLRHTVVGRGYRDGMPGFIEGIYQPFSLFCVYVRLWELQQRPTLEERYARLEKSLP